VAYIAFLILASLEHAALPTWRIAMLGFVMPLTAVGIGVSVWTWARRKRHQP